MTNETRDEIVAEMKRKPDSDYLLGWIAVRARDLSAGMAEDIRAAIDAYEAGLMGDGMDCSRCQQWIDAQGACGCTDTDS